MQERRRSERGPTYLGGRIVSDNRCSTMDCIVKNMSQIGARVVFPTMLAVPKEFDITIKTRGVSRRARVVWTDETCAGIEFVPEAAQATASLEAAIRIRTLEGERDQLKRRVAQLCEPA